MPDPKDDPKSSEWRPYIFARDQWHCRICGDRFYSEMVRKHIANEHKETMRPSVYEYFHGAVWQRKETPMIMTPPGAAGKSYSHLSPLGRRLLTSPFRTMRHLAALIRSLASNATPGLLGSAFEPLRCATNLLRGFQSLRARHFGRLWRSVKYEEVYLRAYDSVSEARASIGRSTNTLSRQAPLPSMLTAIPFLISTPMNAAPVNWLP
jgi:hypothetical protein